MKQTYSLSTRARPSFRATPTDTRLESLTRSPGVSGSSRSEALSMTTILETKACSTTLATQSTSSRPRSHAGMTTVI